MATRTQATLAPVVRPPVPMPPSPAIDRDAVAATSVGLSTISHFDGTGRTSALQTRPTASRPANM